MANASNELETRGVLNRDQVDEVLSFREVLAEANTHGLSPDQVTVLFNPYTTLNQNKDPLLEVPFIIRAVKFHDDPKPNGEVVEYANAWCITEDDKLFRLTDGSTGIFQQLKKIVTKRIEDKHPTPFNYIGVPNGLRKSEYWINKDGKPVDDDSPERDRQATTYYLA